jgi:hypothetical protein
MPVRNWTLSIFALAFVHPLGTFASDRTIALECTGKIGENMYRAGDGTVVWTESCGHDPSCEDAVVTLGNRTNGKVIRWNSGESCWVVNVAAPQEPKRKKANSDKSGSEKSQRSRTKRRR